MLTVPVLAWGFAMRVSEKIFFTARSAQDPSTIFWSYPGEIRFPVVDINFTGHSGAGAKFAKREYLESADVI
jgi:hypothetical protein